VGVGSLGDSGYGILRVSIGGGIEGRTAGDIQFRPGRAVYKRRVYGSAESRWNPDQHGWSGPSAGQRVCRTLVADGAIRRSVLERLRQCERSDRKSETLFPVLQSRAASTN